MEELSRISLPPSATMREAFESLVSSGKRLLAVIGPDTTLLGVLTDGDLRRHLLAGGSLSDSLAQIYNPHPLSFGPDDTIESILKAMRLQGMTAVPWVDANQKLLGVRTWEELTAPILKPKRPVEDLSVAILAGGLGTRLDPVTRILPKALLPLGKSSILEHILKSFQGIGLSQVEVILWHKAEMVCAYLESLEALDPAVTTHIETKPLGTFGGLSLLSKDDLRQDTLVTNCDILLDIDLADLLEKHRKSGAAITLVGAEHKVALPYGVLQASATGELTRLEEKPVLDFVVNAGMYLIRSDLIRALKPDQRIDATEFIEAIQKSGEIVSIYSVAASAWRDIGEWAGYQLHSRFPGAAS